MKTEFFKRVLFTLFGLACATTGWGYVFITNNGTAVKWPAGTIPMQIMVDNSVVLQDGTTRAGSIEAAMQTWNAQIGSVQFSPQITAVGNGTDGNRVNEIFFAGTVYGKAWVSNTLAVTTDWYNTATSQRLEADIIFNSNLSWSSYRGPLQLPDDIRRVVLHELGHVLGLDHPDLNGQSVVAIMNSAESDIDSLQSDDIAGAQSLYGAPNPNLMPQFSGRTLSKLVLVGQPVTFSATVTGSGSLTYHWYHNGQIIAGATSPTYAIGAVTLSDRGTYALTASNNYGTTVSVSALNVAIANGQLLAWGDNQYGESTVPSGLGNVASVAAEWHNLVLRTDGTVVAWGGSPDPSALNVPAGLSGVVAVAAGNGFSLALKSDGTVVAWGDNYAGRVTVPVGLNNVVGIAAGGTFSVALKADGTVVAWGDGGSQGVYTQIPSNLKNVVAIAAGSTHTVALMLDGTVTAWGDVGDGGVYVPTNLVNATAISVGDGALSLALKSDGTVVGWGNAQGATIPPGLSGVIAVAAGGFGHALALKSDGSVVAWGRNSQGEGAVPAGLANVVGVATGNSHSLVIVPILQVPPSFLTAPSSQTVATGNPVTFTASATGTPAPTLQWQKNGVNVSGATGSSFTINSAAAADAGTYIVVATNSGGTVVSNSATLVVEPVTGDFNKDGKSDLVIQNTVTGERSVWLMNGTTRSSTASLTMLSPDWQIAGTGDFNGDGNADLIWQNTTTGDRYLWLMNGSTHTSTVYLTTLSTDWQIAGSGDFNGDGQSDLIWQNKVTGDRYIWLMNGTTHTSTVYLTTLSPAWQIAGSGDFNGDGQSDLIWQNTVTGDCYIWLMNGTSVASKVYLGTVGTQWQIGGSGDFNGDGQADLYWTNTVTGERTVWLMNGTTHASTVSLGILSRDWVLGRPITMPKLAAADFNADGNSDLVWQNTVTGDRYLWLMNGTTHTSSVYLGNLAVGWQIAGTGDFNADGQSDIIWQNVNSGDRFIWLMNGTTLQANVYVGTVPPQWQIVGSGDFNGDGQTDLLWQNTVTGDRYFWLMNGTTMASTVYLTTLSTDWQIAGTGDFNGDGQPDIIWQNTVTGDRYLWLMNGTTHVSTVYLTNLSPQWQIVGSGDFNGDGQSDILWQNTVTGDRYVWLMNGTSPTSAVYLGNLSTQWLIRD